MSKRTKSLVILAAGIGSRFSGGIKQLHCVGPTNECIMDYSIYDALEAGFNRIVFIIRKDIEDLFELHIGNRIRQVCKKHGAEVICAFQDKYDLPGGFICPDTRTKPWGTGHALLSCKGILDGGFVVINADDYYGKEPYRQMSAFLDSLEEIGTGNYAIAAFLLHNTLSEHGGVTRGLCTVDTAGNLTDIQETRKIKKTPCGPCVETPEGTRYLDEAMPVSMNMWAFTPDVLDRLDKQFLTFLADGGLEDPSSEFLIPTQIGQMLDKGVVVKVIPTQEKWFGMTYAEDIPSVQASFLQLVQDGIYRTPLFE